MRRTALATGLAVALGLAPSPAGARTPVCRISHAGDMLRVCGGVRQLPRPQPVVLPAPVALPAPIAVAPDPIPPADPAPDAPPADQPAPTPTPAPIPPPAAPVYPSRLAVDENEYSVHPTHNPVAAGSVEFNVTNFGMDDHDLTITAAAGGPQLAHVDLHSQQASTVVVSLPAGDYALFCSLPGHRALGMQATLQVR